MWISKLVVPFFFGFPLNVYFSVIFFNFFVDGLRKFILFQGLLTLPLFALLRLYLREKYNRSTRADEQEQICGIYSTTRPIGISDNVAVPSQVSLKG